AMARMARQLDAGRLGIWVQLRTRFQQVWARAAILLIPSPFPPTPRLAIRGSKRHRIEASADGQSCPLAYDRGVEPQAAAMVQEEVLPITPITTEILDKIN